MSKATIGQIAELFRLISKGVITAEMIKILIDASKAKDVSSRKTKIEQVFLKDFKGVKIEALDDLRKVVQGAIDANNFDLVVNLIEGYFSFRKDKEKFFADLVRRNTTLGNLDVVFNLVESAQIFQRGFSFANQEIPWNAIGRKALEKGDFRMARLAADKTPSSWVRCDLLLRIAEKTLDRRDYKVALDLFNERKNSSPYAKVPARDRFNALALIIEETEKKAALSAKTD